MSRLRLLQRDLSRHRARLAGIGLAVAASVAVVVLLGAVAFGLHRYVLKPLLPQLPLELLKVEPRTVSLGLFAFDTSGGGGGLAPNVLNDLEHLDGVTHVYPVVGARVPLRAEGGEGFIGRRLRTDVFASGLPLELVKDELAKGQVFEDRPDGPVPVIVARRLLELYNTTVAPALNKPKLSERVAIGFEFVLQLGRSASGGSVHPAKFRSVRAQIVGFSDRASLAGITVPEATVRRWNQEFEFESTITGAWVRLRAPRYAGPVSRRIEQRGLHVDSTPKLVGAALSVGGALFGLFSGLLLLLSAFAIAQVFFLMVAERKTELAILRALGARRTDLAQLVLLEAFVVGLIGGGVGVGAGSLIAVALNAGVLASLPDLPFQPEALIYLSPGLIGFGWSLGVAAAVGGAALPAVFASRADPARALRT